MNEIGITLTSGRRKRQARIPRNGTSADRKDGKKYGLLYIVSLTTSSQVFLCLLRSVKGRIKQGISVGWVGKLTPEPRAHGSGEATGQR